MLKEVKIITIMNVKKSIYIYWSIRCCWASCICKEQTYVWYILWRYVQIKAQTGLTWSSNLKWALAKTTTLSLSCFRLLWDCMACINMLCQSHACLLYNCDLFWPIFWLFVVSHQVTSTPPEKKHKADAQSRHAGHASLSYGTNTWFLEWSQNVTTSHKNCICILVYAPLKFL